MKYIDRTKLFKKYSEKWVAMDDNDRVICAGNKAEEVFLKAKKKGLTEPVITKILNPHHDYLLG